MSLRTRVLRHDTPTDERAAPDESRDDMWRRLQPEFQALTAEVREHLSSLPDRATMSDDWLRTQAESELIRLFRQPAFATSVLDEAFLRGAVINDILGFGPIQDFIDDPSVSEVMVNAAHNVYIERNGVITKTERSFESDDHLRRVVDRMLRASGRRVDQSSPMVDARLEDGSRLNVVLPPLSVDGPAVTIRKFHAKGFTVTDLVEQGSLSAESAQFLQQAVSRKLNILVSGGTGTGKTTLLNILTDFVGNDERVVTIEDAVDLTGAYNGIRASVEALKKSAPASIINISSTAGMRGYRSLSAYSAAKFGLRGLTKSVALDLASMRIRCNTVHPGPIDTPMMAGHEDAKKQVAMRRIGKPDEIAQMVVFLASDESSFSTGSEFVADGGELAGLAPS